MKHAELIARLEAAEVGSREFDVRMEAACNPSEWGDGDLEIALEDPDHRLNPQHFTTSLDAAVALAERVLPGWSWSAIKGEAVCEAYAWRRANVFADVQGVAKTPELAFCVAILRALDAKG